MKLVVENISFAFQEQAPLWQNVSFTLNKGEIMTVLGSNGIGKTTMLRVLIGFFHSVGNGSIKLIDDDKKEYDPLYNLKKFTEKISYVPQVQNTAYSFQLRDYVVMGRAPHLGLFKQPAKEDYELADEVLQDLGSYHLRYRSFNTLSGGQQRQAVIARAIVQQPQLIIMDEPTNHLDYGNQFRVLKLVQKLSAKGIAVILTTHMPEQAFYLGGKTAVLRTAGLQVGEASEVLTEQTLEEIYHLKIKLLRLKKWGRTICVPY